MADVKQIEVNGVTYDICDAVARESIGNFRFAVAGDGRYVFQASATDETKAVAMSVQPSDNSVYMDYMTNSVWNGVIPLNSTVAGVASKSAYVNGQYATFNFAFKTNYASSDVRAPILVIAGHQSKAAAIMSATLKGNGTGVGSTGITVSNGTFTVDAGTSSWAIVTVIYDPKWMTITPAS